MKRVEIDPTTLEEPVRKPVQSKPSPAPIDIPQEKPAPPFQKETTAASVMKAPLMGRDGPVADALHEPAEKMQPLDAKTMKQLMEGSRNAPALPADPLKDLVGNAGSTSLSSSVPAFSSLDALLEGKETLSPATAPILMPTDLLFGYNATTLKPEAAKSLEKLGTLIARNTNARFRIEGHTDSFGSDAYNRDLSLRRAEEVKTWLVKSRGIDPARITTAGLGKSRLLVPGTGSIDAQQLNRRVEIVITQAGIATP